MKNQKTQRKRKREKDGDQSYLVSIPFSVEVTGCMTFTVGGKSLKHIDEMIERMNTYEDLTCDEEEKINTLFQTAFQGAFKDSFLPVDDPLEDEKEDEHDTEEKIPENEEEGEDEKEKEGERETEEEETPQKPETPFLRIHEIKKVKVIEPFEIDSEYGYPVSPDMRMECAEEVFKSIKRNKERESHIKKRQKRSNKREDEKQEKKSLEE